MGDQTALDAIRSWLPEDQLRQPFIESNRGVILTIMHQKSDPQIWKNKKINL
jgi:hypothetical protein